MGEGAGEPADLSRPARRDAGVQVLGPGDLLGDPREPLDRGDRPSRQPPSGEPGGRHHRRRHEGEAGPQGGERLVHLRDVHRHLHRAPADTTGHPHRSARIPQVGGDHPVGHPGDLHVPQDRGARGGGQLAVLRADRQDGAAREAHDDRASRVDDLHLRVEADERAPHPPEPLTSRHAVEGGPGLAEGHPAEQVLVDASAELVPRGEQGHDRHEAHRDRRHPRQRERPAPAEAHGRTT